MLMNAGIAKLLDDRQVLINFHKRFEIHVGDACRLFVYGQQQIEILLIEFGAANFPHALANRGDVVKLPIIIAELAF